MIKNIIFDIGNVLLQFNPRKYFARRFQDEALANVLCDAMMSDGVWNKYDLGDYTLDDVKQLTKAKLPQYEDMIDEMLSIWVKILEPMDYTLEKMRMLKKNGYRIYLLSNLNKEAYDYIKDQCFIFDYVDGYILSFQEHLIKPDQEIYKCLCKRFSLIPNECIFIDDLEANIVAAQEYGMNTIHFVHEKQVEKELTMLLKV